MCVTFELVLDILGRNVLKFCFPGTSLLSARVPHVWSMLRLSCLTSVNSSSSCKTQLLTFNKSHVLSPLPFVNLARPLQPIYATSSLIIVRYWFLCESNDLSAAGGTVSERRIAWRPDCHVVCPVDDFPMKVTSSAVKFIGLLALEGKGGQQAGIKAGYR